VRYPLISLLHPTRRVTPSKGFPRGWREAHDAWLSRADHPERIEYVLAVHKSRWQTFRDGEMFVGAFGSDEVDTVNLGRDCVVDQLNEAALASTGAILMGIQDDIFPPQGWDTMLLDAFEFDVGPIGASVNAKGDTSLPEAAAVFSSGATPERDRELMIAGAITRKRYERYGHILDPDFESMYADNYNAWRIRRDADAGLCVLIERLDIKFEHRHPSLVGGPVDAAYEQENRQEAYLAGSVIFHQKVSGSNVMVMCLPGETFRSELVGSRFQLIEDAKARTRFGIVAPHWCFTSNVYATRIELAKKALEFPTITPEADLVFWADDDNPVDFQQLSFLIADLDARPDLDMVVGWCWCDHAEAEDSQATKWVMSCGRQGVQSLVCLRFAGSDFDAAIERGSFLISSDDIVPHRFWSGFPCVLMRRSALARLGPLAFAPILDSRAKDGYTSEDTSFFWNVGELGLKVAVDIRVQVPHIKWRGITPQYVPERERGQVEKVQGRKFEALST
jgi:hypothetical protein